ncbi:16789_t:CDS:2, partial [Gigaspora rosea]
LNSSQLRTIGEVVRPKGTYGTILELQNMLKKNFESISEPDDLFSDEENTIMNENFSPIALEYYLDLDVAYIFDLIRCEMIAKGLPQRTNLERDIDVFIKRYIFSCFDDILDIHFTNRGYLDKYELDTTMAKTIAAILADFDIPTKYEELGSVIKISCIMLQIKKLLSTTISRYNRIKSKAKNEKFTSGRVPMFSGQQEHQ